eukprot:tig00000655_g2889.t1
MGNASAHAEGERASSPKRDANDSRGERIFDKAMKDACWSKATTIAGRDPQRWRLDAVGNIVCKKLTSCEGCLCHEYDHITPYSKGGKTELSNCQILQTRVNRFKGNKILEGEELRKFSCDLNLTERDLDVVEMAVYGNIRRVGLVCKVPTLEEIQSGNAKDPCRLPDPEKEGAGRVIGQEGFIQSLWLNVAGFFYFGPFSGSDSSRRRHRHRHRKFRPEQQQHQDGAYFRGRARHLKKYQ